MNIKVTKHVEQLKKWKEEIELLRKIALKTNLEEELKWDSPCYTLNGKNVFILSTFKDFVTVNFFKGVLIKDEINFLIFQGESQQSSKTVRLKSIHEIKKNEKLILDYMKRAIDVEKSGAKVTLNKDPLIYPKVLLDYFNKDHRLQSAFKSLLRGAQREYLLYFMNSKYETTQKSRIEANIEKIKEGKRLRDK